MKKNISKKMEFITQTAIVAGLYVALTLAVAPLAFGSVQLRVSEVLTILPIFMPSSIVGLTIGCFIANMLSFSLWDMLFGTLATLIAAILTYMLRNVRWKGTFIVPMLPPVIVNALIIGAEITYIFTPELATSWVLFMNIFSVAIGQIIACMVLGVPLATLVERSKILKRFAK